MSESPFWRGFWNGTLVSYPPIPALLLGYYLAKERWPMVIAAGAVLLITIVIADMVLWEATHHE